jgi:mercuric ion transport protein
VNRERIAAGGAVAAAFASCLCCVGPIAAFVLGFGAVAVPVEPLRPYLLAASVLALGFGFRRAYQRSNAECRPGGPCEPERASRTSRAGLWLAAVAVLTFGLVPSVTGPLSAAFSDVSAAGSGDATHETAPAAKATTTLEVRGMTCAGCETTVRLALERAPGVVSASASFARGEALVEYDPALTTPETLAHELSRQTGYESTPKEAR